MLSRYWDVAVPLADSSRLAAANEMSPSPSISVGSVISGQMACHVHVLGVMAEKFCILPCKISRNREEPACMPVS